LGQSEEGSISIQAGELELEVNIILLTTILRHLATQVPLQSVTADQGKCRHGFLQEILSLHGNEDSYCGHLGYDTTQSVCHLLLPSSECECTLNVKTRWSS
jgi:hypothetical protein